MGTTRVKVIDLSSSGKEVKASRKHAAKVVEKSLNSNIEESTLEEKKIQPENPQENVAKTNTETINQETNKQSTKRSSNYQNSKSQILSDKIYNPQEAIELLYKTKVAKFDPSVEMHVNVSDKKVKGTVKFPHPIENTIKEKRYLVFASKKQEIEGKKIIWADEDTVSKIEKGLLKPGRDFDQVIASAKIMPQLVSVAKVLGPAGMMPNPKNGTITENVESALGTTEQGSWEFRTDPQAPIVHAKIGKLSNTKEEIQENAKALILAIGQSKIKKATVNSTMSPSIKLDFQTI